MISRLALGRAAVVHFAIRLANFVDISVFDFFNTTATVEFFPDHFISLNELVYLSGKLVILRSDYVDMIVHRVYFILHGRVVLVQSLV